MAPFAYILIGVGAYLFTSELKKGKDNEQDVSDSSGTRRTGGDHSYRTGESRSGRNRPRSVKATGKSTLVTGDQNELQTNRNLHGNQSGDNRGGQQHGSTGRSKTESVTVNKISETETDNVEGESNEDERNRNGGGRNNGNDVSGESSGGDESAGPETA